MTEAEEESTIEFKIKGSLVDAIFSGDINKLEMNLSTGQENVIKFYTQLKSGTNPLKVDGENTLTQFNTKYEAIKDTDTELETYLKENVTYEKKNDSPEEKKNDSPEENNKFHPYTITVNVTDAEGKTSNLDINNKHLKETVDGPATGGGKTRKGGRKHKRKQRKSAKRKSSRKRKTK